MYVTSLLTSDDILSTVLFRIIKKDYIAFLLTILLQFIMTYRLILGTEVSVKQNTYIGNSMETLSCPEDAYKSVQLVLGGSTLEKDQSRKFEAVVSRYLAKVNPKGKTIVSV